MFGVIGMTPEVHRRAREAFGAPWESYEVDATASSTFGAHSHRPGTALVRTARQMILADGEVSLYSRLAERGAAAWSTDLSGIALPPECRGNLAIWSSAAGRLAIASEWTGTFPLYYAHRRGAGFLFSSRMAVIASAVQPPIDKLGLVEFLRDASFQSGRSLWTDVRRLQPGQSLLYDVSEDHLTVTERSRLWASVADRKSVDGLLEETWSRLEAAVDGDKATSIMLSGGWDSRTLLAAAIRLVSPERLMAYTHGDPASREIRLAQRLAGEAGIAFHQEPIDRRCYDIDALRCGYEREEHVVFPHWHRAGRIAREMGGRVVTAGVYGEILGGHYGRTMLLQGSAKARELLRGMFSRSGSSRDPSAIDVATLKSLLHVPALVRPWAIREDWWHAASVSLGELNADIDHDVDRLRERGVTSIDQLIEAYVSEHRGSQYINAQIRGCRAYTDVSLPFASRNLLELACAVPLPAKIHNRASRSLLRRFSPTLLNYPMAATLAAARWPILVQEASRLARVGFQASLRRIQSRRGMRREPRLSWVNFDFLRHGNELRSIVGDLKAELWDKAAMLGRLDDLARRPSESMHPMSDQLMKVYTIDLALRR